MVRNIPNRFTKDAMILEFNKHFEGEYDFFYLPIDFNNKCNVGYAFINFKTPKAMIDFHQRYNGNTWPKFKSNKVCAITFARLQGREAMLKHFEDSGGGERNFHLTCFHSNSSGDIKSLGDAIKGSSSANSIQSSDTTASSEEDVKLTNALHSNIGLAMRRRMPSDVENTLKYYSTLTLLIKRQKWPTDIVVAWGSAVNCCGSKIKFPYTSYI